MFSYSLRFPCVFKIIEKLERLKPFSEEMVKSENTNKSVSVHAVHSDAHRMHNFKCDANV